MIQILEQFYTVKMARGELQTLVKAVQCVELYEGQGPDIKQEQLTENEIKFLRDFRAIFDELAAKGL